MPDHDDSGLRGLLTLPRVYDAFQSLVGSDGYRRWYVETLLKPTPGMRILDIGCGPGTMLRFLPEDVYYTGFDMNPKYIEYAKRKFAGRGTFVAQRVGEALVAAEGFDAVMANAIFHHINDEEAAHLVRVAWTQLKPGGFLLTYDNAWVKGQSPIARWLISKDRGRHVRTPDEYLALVRTHFHQIETTIRHDSYRIPYTNFTMKALKV